MISLNRSGYSVVVVIGRCCLISGNVVQHNCRILFFFFIGVEEEGEPQRLKESQPDGFGDVGDGDTVVVIERILLHRRRAQIRPRASTHHAHDHCKYRVTHLLANLGWVDLDFDCSTVCLILLQLVGIWPEAAEQLARWWNIPNQSQPNTGLPGDWSPCTNSGLLSGLKV